MTSFCINSRNAATRYKCTSTVLQTPDRSNYHVKYAHHCSDSCNVPIASYIMSLGRPLLHAVYVLIRKFQI